MSLETLLNLPDPWGRVNRFLYEFGYGCLRGVVLMFFRPLFKIRRVGSKPRLPLGPVIFCANHASYLDPAFVQLVVPRRVAFVMTNEFYRRRSGRWFFRLVRAIPVAPGRMAKTGFEQALARLRRGSAICIFPEGRLSRDGTMGRAQRGVAVLSRMGGAPVVPMGIAGNYETWPRGARWFRRGDVRVAFAPAIEPPDAAHLQGRAAEQAYADGILESVALARGRAERHNRSGQTV
ncbi:MAG: lysophospholipid acyltransferase family protein [Planctomycetota bacterium]